MSTLPSSCQHPRIFIFTHPRTASNLFMRLFKNHPDLSVTSYTFQDAFISGPEPLSRRNNAPFIASKGGKNPDATYQNSFNQLQKFIANAEAAGKIPFIKEHLSYITDPQVVAANIICLSNGTPRIVNPRPAIEDSTSVPTELMPLPSNPTLLPTKFLKTVSPVILIRHPGKIIPSFYRASRNTIVTTVFDEEFPVEASLRWPRLIFSWYEEYYRIAGIKQRPIVIDAEDIINDSYNVIEKFCAMTGLDPKYIRYSWEESNCNDECNPVRAAFLSTLRNSTGIIRGDQKPIVIADEAQKWTEEFGEEISQAMMSYVNAAVPDYEYLMKFRLCSESRMI